MTEYEKLTDEDLKNLYETVKNEATRKQLVDSMLKIMDNRFNEIEKEYEKREVEKKEVEETKVGKYYKNIKYEMSEDGRVRSLRIVLKAASSRDEEYHGETRRFEYHSSSDYGYTTKNSTIVKYTVLDFDDEDVEVTFDQWISISKAFNRGKYDTIVDCERKFQERKENTASEDEKTCSVEMDDNKEKSKINTLRGYMTPKELENELNKWFGNSIMWDIFRR